MYSPPPLLAKFVNKKHLFLFNFNEILFGNIIRDLLEYLSKPINIFLLYFLKHLLTFRIEIFSTVEICIFLLFLLFFFFDLFHFLAVEPIEAEYIVEIFIVDMCSSFFINSIILDQLDIELGSLLQCVIMESPAW